MDPLLLPLRLALPTVTTPVLDKPPSADIGGHTDDKDVDHEGRTAGALAEETEGAGSSSSSFTPHGSKNSGRKWGRRRCTDAGEGKGVKEGNGGTTGNGMAPSAVCTATPFPPSGIRGVSCANRAVHEDRWSGPPIPAFASSGERKKIGVFEPVRPRLLSTDAASEGRKEATDKRCDPPEEGIKDDTGGGAGGVEEALSERPGITGSVDVETFPIPLSASSASSSAVAVGDRRRTGIGAFHAISVWTIRAGDQSEFWNFRRDFIFSLSTYQSPVRFFLDVRRLPLRTAPFSCPTRFSASSVGSVTAVSSLSFSALASVAVLLLPTATTSSFPSPVWVLSWEAWCENTRAGEGEAAVGGVSSTFSIGLLSPLDDEEKSFTPIC